ncbi:MAG: histidine kinase [Acidobacteria bacterium]|nr:histidine kinase [Acidobacteriota bacterium]MCA1640775.1 histidine kinase [Acidobacteriota bacterium]
MARYVGAVSLLATLALSPRSLHIGDTALAQRLAARAYNVADGLGHATVTSIYQDEKGYLWFGTYEGVSRYDGYGFTDYSVAAGLSHQLVLRVFGDGRGGVWVNTYDGRVARLSDPATGEGRRFDVFEMRNARGANAARFDREGRLWCVTAAGVNRATTIEPEGNSFQFELVAPSSDPARLGSDYSVLDQSDRLWFGMAHDLVEIAPDGRTNRYGLGEGVARAQVHGIAASATGRVFVANSQAVYEFAPAEAEGERRQGRRLPFELTAGAEIHAITLDHDDRLWIGTTRELLSFHDGERATHRIDGLSSPIETLFVDRENILWVGTASNGAFKLTGAGIVSYTVAEGLPQADVSRIIEGADGRIYAVTSENGIAEIVGDRAVVVEGSRLPPFDRIGQRILRDRRGDFRAMTNDAVLRFGGPALRFPPAQSFPRLQSRERQYRENAPLLFEDSQSRLWSSQGESLVRFDPHNENAPAPRILISARELHGVMQMAEDRAGGLWLSSHGGLGRMTGGSFTLFRETEGLPETLGRSLYLDSRGWLWIGLRYGGVSVTHDPAAPEPRFTNYSTRNGLVSNTVSSITEDHEGRMYFATPRGLGELEPATGRFRHFTTASGLANDRLRYCMTDSRGRIWVATTTGVSRLDARARETSGYAPPIYFTHIQIAGEDVALPETGANEAPEMHLSASQDHLSVEFVGLSYRGGVRYQYRLEGTGGEQSAGDEWSAPLSGRTFNFLRLAPGVYRLAVRAVTPDGATSDRPATFAFRISPPFYLQTWFIALAALALTALAFTLYRFRLRQLRREFTLVLSERARMGRELHDTLAQGLTGISIQLESARATLTNAPTDAARHLERAREMALASLAEARRAVGALRSLTLEGRSLADALTALAAQMRGPIAVRSETIGEPRPLGTEVEDNLFHIAQEAVTNALKHAGAREIVVRLEYELELARLSVEDDGRGFDLKENGRNGFGLVGMRERAEGIGGALRVERQAAGGGTRIVVEVKRGN